MIHHALASLSPVSEGDALQAPGAHARSVVAPRARTARLPISEHTRFIQEVRAMFPGAKVIQHDWQAGGAD